MSRRRLILGGLALAGWLGGAAACLFGAWLATCSLNHGLVGRTDMLVTWMAAGVGATAFLAGVIEWFDRPLVRRERSFVIRWPVEWLKRIVMLGQLATMGLALGGAAILAFGFSSTAVEQWVGR